MATTDRARIRFYVTPPGASTSERVRLRRVAEHEYRIMSRLGHDGLLKPRDVVEDELGAGLVYPYDAMGLAALVQQALPAVEEAIDSALTDAPEGDRPVVLTDLAPLARYDQLNLLVRWSDLTAHRPQPVWVLVPQLMGNQGPLVDGRPLPLAALGQYVRLDTDWLAGAPTTAAAGPTGS